MQEMRDKFLGLRRSPGVENGNLLQYSCLENFMDRGAWWATVHGVAKRQTQWACICACAHTHTHTQVRSWASQVALEVKNQSASAGEVRETGSIPQSGRSPGGHHGNPLQYSCLENPMDGEAWQAMVHRVAKSWTRLKWLSTHIHMRSCSNCHSVTGLFHLAWCPPDLCVLLHTVAFASSFSLKDIPLHVYITFFYSFIHWCTFRLFPHLGCGD